MAAGSSRKDSSPGRFRPEWMEWLRWAYRAAIVLALLAGGLYGFHEAEQKLISDPRFRIAGAPEYGMEPPGIRIEGVSHASRKEILDVFANDTEKSLYLLPAAERCRQLGRIEWVKSATVARLWPNEVLVQIRERIPVALLRADAKRGWLVDAEGVLMRIPPNMDMRLPVVKGLSGKDTPEQRAERIKRMLRVMKDSGPHGEKFKMIDVSDMDNVKVTLPVGDRSLTLWLGGRNFLSRIDGFEASYPRILREMPSDTVFDLRLDNRISNVPEAGQDVKGE
jgi:cell division septal protein FtsQ